MSKGRKVSKAAPENLNWDEGLVNEAVESVSPSSPNIGACLFMPNFPWYKCSVKEDDVKEIL